MDFPGHLPQNTRVCQPYCTVLSTLLTLTGAFPHVLPVEKVKFELQPVFCMWKECFSSNPSEGSLTWLTGSPALIQLVIVSVQFSSVAQKCPTLCNPMNCSTPGLPVHHQLPEFIQTHVHRVSDAIQPSHPRSSPSPPAPNPSQHQSLFQWVNTSHEVAKVLEFQL